MHSSLAPYSIASCTRRDELLAVVLVGVRRALALAEPAERAADDADVRDVDVAVDHERDRLPRELLAQLVRGLADLLDRLRARLREQRRQLVRAQRDPVAALLDRARHQVGADRRRRVGAAGAPPRDEAPVLQLDRVHHALRDPLGVDVLRVDAQPLGQRVRRPPAAACAPGGARGTGARGRCDRRWR